VRIEVSERAGAPPVPNPHDGTATVRWVSEHWDDDYDPAALAVTVTSYDGDSGRIRDADIVVNAQHYPWTTALSPAASCAAYDLQDVLTHEVGHLFGLAHDVGDVDATMFPSADACETKKRALHAPDLDGLRYLYVELGPAPEGCAVGGRPGGPGWAALALLAGVVALRRRAAPAILLLLAAVPAHATLARRLGPDELGRGAALVVQATVRSADAAARGDRVYTDVVLDVTGCLKGACPAAVTVRQLGGEVGGRGMAVEGTARLTVGGEVILFLRPRRDGAFAIVGMAQGAYAVERGVDGQVRALARDLSGLGFVGEAGHGRVERIRPEELRRALDSRGDAR